MKTRYTLFIYILLGLFIISGCGKDKKEANKKAQATKQIPVDTALKRRLQEFAAKPRVKGAFGLYVYDLTAQKPVYGYAENKAQPSASCMKLITGIAGLHLLGTRHQFATSLYYHGTIKNDTLHGDLCFRGGMDPQFNEPDLKLFTSTLRRRGVKKFTGKLILDLLIEEPVKSEEHWYPWDLSFSKYGLLFKGKDRVGRAVRNALRARGITVADSQIVTGKLPNGSCLLVRYRHYINPVIKRMWKNSSNTQATSLLYAIGHQANPKASPTEAGVNYLRHFLRNDLGMKDSTLVIHDGCGLCTYNRLSPVALVAALRYGYEHKDIYQSLNRNLAVAGVDGTMMRGYGNPKVRGKIRAKTGTLSHPYGISSLAGYCEGSNGHLLAFAIMDSEMSVLDAHVLQHKLCETLVK